MVDILEFQAYFDDQCPKRQQDTESKGDQMAENIRARLALTLRNTDLAERVGVELNKLGFRTLQTAHRGVSFEGPPALFESVFQCRVSHTDNGYRFENNPIIPVPIADGVASVYFPTKPKFFSKTI